MEKYKYYNLPKETSLEIHFTNVCEENYSYYLKIYEYTLQLIEKFKTSKDDEGGILLHFDNNNFGELYDASIDYLLLSLDSNPNIWYPKIKLNSTVQIEPDSSIILENIYCDDNLLEIYFEDFEKNIVEFSPEYLIHNPFAFNNIKIVIKGEFKYFYSSL